MPSIASHRFRFHLSLHRRHRSPSPCPPSQKPTENRPVNARRSYGVRLEQVNKADHDADSDSGIDIIAIHGLDTRSPDTWVYHDKASGRSVNWLADKAMLPAEVSGARIFTCDWPAELFQRSDSSPDTIEELARLLLAGIQARPSPQSTRAMRGNRSLLFIASCLGGIILIKALVLANSQDMVGIQEATRGLVFLATPFRGTSFLDVAWWAEPTLKLWASAQGSQVTTLLEWVKTSDSTHRLSDLVCSFEALCDQRGYLIKSFYEKGFTTTRLFSRSSKLLVDQRSATLDRVPHPLPLKRPHVLMNKFYGPKEDDAEYRMVVEQIQDLLKIIRHGTPLERADRWIREQHYNEERLKIERLSGETLHMDQCYINLALVNRQTTNSSKLDSSSSRASPFSLAERLKIETPARELQVDLPRLFQPRTSADGGIRIPKRILIRGRAGVGKTTLCKKIVHGFVHQNLWQDMRFNRLIWIRLRDLKDPSLIKCNFAGLVEHIFFRHYSSGDSPQDALLQQVVEGNARDTLFLLDGLDEVTEIAMARYHDSNHPRHELLLELLKKPYVIITTRPHAVLPGPAPDLELDAIGFSPYQVQEYLRRVIHTPGHLQVVQSCLQKNQLMLNLVRIPVLLDGLCSIWQARSSTRTHESHGVPETMTAVYKEITEQLWLKDLQRLDKAFNGIPLAAEREAAVSDESNTLAYLAFSGIISNVIEFQKEHREAVYPYLQQYVKSCTLDEMFGRLSFLRTSDSSAAPSVRSYHFIHLTFQEYFAAKYFVDAWKGRRNLRYLNLNDRRVKEREVSCQTFLQEHKYSPGYSIVWRFVAGLLDAEGQDDIGRFFRALERRPFDLLGPAHQRLVVNCLSEAVSLPPDHPIRAHREERIVLWTWFDWDLASKPELPDRVLENCWDRMMSQRYLLNALAEAPRPLSGRLIASILDLAKDKETKWDRRARAIRALSGTVGLPGSVTFALLEMIQDPAEHDNVRDSAAHTLVKQSTSPQAVEDLLRDNQPFSIRHFILRSLVNQSNLPETTITLLHGLIEPYDIDNDDEHNLNLHMDALDVLAAQSDLPEASIALMLRLLKDDLWFLGGPAKVLANQSTLSSSVIGALEETVMSYGPRVDRASAAHALANQSNSSRPVIAALEELLQGPYHESDREDAAGALANQSNLSGAAITFIVKYINRGAGILERRQSMLPVPAVKALEKLLENDEPWEVKECAVKLLAKQPDVSRPAVVFLENLIQGDNPLRVRLIAVEIILKAFTIWRLDSSDPVIMALEHILEQDSEDPELQSVAARALSSQPGLPGAAIRSLEKLFKSASTFVEATELCLYSARALANRSNAAGPVADEARDFLGDVPQDECEWNELAIDAQRMWIIRHMGFRSEVRQDMGKPVFADPQEIQDTYIKFLDWCFSGEISMYSEGGHCIINLPSGPLRAPLQDESLFQAAVLDRQRHLMSGDQFAGQVKLWGPFEGEDSDCEEGS